MLAEVRAGKRVCGAFYGHPGVFAGVPHEAIEQARREGYDAHMEPGVSAEDCLYADLGIDPGRYGCQHFEASQLMLYRRRIDPSAYLVLWQVGVAGDRSLMRFATGAEYRQVLVDVLTRDYDARARGDRLQGRDAPDAAAAHRAHDDRAAAGGRHRHARHGRHSARARAAARRSRSASDSPHWIGREGRVESRRARALEFTSCAADLALDARKRRGAVLRALLRSRNDALHRPAVDARRRRTSVPRRSRSDAGHAAARPVPDAGPRRMRSSRSACALCKISTRSGGGRSWA